MTNKILFVFLILSSSIRLLNGQIFTDVALEVGIDYINSSNLGGAVIFDYNNDGFEDIYLTGGYNADVLLKNNGNGSFSNVTNLAGLFETGVYVTSGAAAADINNDGFRDLFVTTVIEQGINNRYASNLLFLNKGNGTFENISASSHIDEPASYSASVTFGDINNDGYVDIYVGNLFNETFQFIIDNPGNYTLTSAPNNLYLNNGDNTFTEIAGLNPVRDTGITFQAVFIDIDNDDDLDIYCGNDYSGGIYYPNSVFLNNAPDLSFTDISVSSLADESKSAMGIAIADYNEDGWTDLYITNGGRNTLFKNNGNNTFTDETDVAGVGDALVSINDFNNHHFACIVNYTPATNFIGQDTLILELCGNGGGICGEISFLINVNDDNDFTYYSKDSIFRMNVPKNSSGVHAFIVSESTQVNVTKNVVSGVATVVHDHDRVPSVGWGTNFLDYDNDSYLDLFIANGGLDAEVDNPNTLFKGNADYTFENVSVAAGIDNPWPARGSLTLDYQEDGDIDIVVINRPYMSGFGNQHYVVDNLYQNNSDNDNKWLKVKLTGTESNRDAIGAKIIAVVGGRRLVRIIDGGSSSMSQNSIIAHWGLGDYTMIDTLKIIWPGGCRQNILQVPTNQMLEITQDCGSTIILADMNIQQNLFSKLQVFPNPTSNFINIQFQSTINDHYEFEIYDQSGRQINNTQSGELVSGETNLIKLDISQIASGLYSYCLKTKSSNYCNNIAIVR